MAMPWQLRRGLMERRKSRRREPRPIAECLPSININDLSQQIPRNYATITLPNAGLKYPQVASMRLTYHNIEVTHTTGRIQSFRLSWIKTGFGYPRPAMICNGCQQPRIKLYFRYGSLACRRCQSAIHGSQACSKDQRPILQAQRLKTFLSLKTYMRQTTRNRLTIRLRKAPKHTLVSKPIPDQAMLPASNYAT